ncbi:hypothetical protein LQZ21_13955 [Treponema sp. TIM-1]|uniref:hypothetical protein n=1 Tax=Treponema sp. TIM-1 TaxID=2898417 RepID=UPI0039814069
MKAGHISDAVREINEGKLVLPVIQRYLFRDEEKMELLFDTLLKEGLQIMRSFLASYLYSRSSLPCLIASNISPIVILVFIPLTFSKGDFNSFLFSFMETRTKKKIQV